MMWTKNKPTQPGWYWFLRKGHRSPVPEFVRVYYRRGKLVTHIGRWLGANWADDFPLENYLDEHQWSSEPIPMPSK